MQLARTCARHWRHDPAAISVRTAVGVRLLEGSWRRRAHDSLSCSLVGVRQGRIFVQPRIPFDYPLLPPGERAELWPGGLTDPDHQGTVVLPAHAGMGRPPRDPDSNTHPASVQAGGWFGQGQQTCPVIRTRVTAVQSPTMTG